MSSEVNYRQQWVEGEIEAGTLLDVIDALQYANLRLSQDRGVAKYERDAALAQLSALEAENARLVEDVKKWQALAQNVETLERITESAEARRAQLAAIQGGMGETIEPCTDLNHHERYRAGWNACLAQHQRITAAMAAEVERLRADNGVVAHANLLRAQQAEQERDALRAELETLRKDASAEMFLTLTAELAKLRAELAEVKGREAVEGAASCNN